jgi:hypothetical protein
VVTDGVDISSVADLRRSFTAHQRTALEFRDPTCTVEGCSRTEASNATTGPPGAEIHLTAVDDADRLCRHHHDLKTTQGWALYTG